MEGDKCQGVGNVVADHDATLEALAPGAFVQLLLYAIASSRLGAKLRLGGMEWLSESLESWQQRTH